MVNQKDLKDLVAKGPPSMPHGGEIFRHIFETNPELKKFWDVEDIEPDQVAKSRQMQQRGASLLTSIHYLVNNVDQERPFRQEMAELRDTFKELGLGLADAKKLQSGILKFFEGKLGKASDAQKKAWAEFFEKYTAGLKEVGLQ